jgi:hypothetical protein
VIDFGATEQAGDLGGVEGVGLEGVAQAGVDGKAGGDGERGWSGDVALAEEVEQGGVLFVDADE